MRNKTKIWLITAAFLVLIGCVIFGGVMTVLNWDFTKLSTVKYETNEYEIHEPVQNISIVSDTADIVFVPSENAKSSVVCYEQKNMKHAVTVKDSTLVIDIQDTRKWYEHIGITLGTPKITVSIPQGEYGALSIQSSTGNVEIPTNFKLEGMDIAVSTGDVTCLASASEQIKIKTSTGDIRVENVSADALALSVSTGKVIAQTISCEGDVTIDVSTGDAELTDIACKSVTSTGSTGHIALKNVIATETFSIERNTGDVLFDGCDAAEIFVKTSTGRVKGTLLTEKVFITETGTGDVDVPKTVSGGKCEIATGTGDIQIDIQNEV